MLVAAAVCPCPPLLVPEVASGAAPEMADARAACVDALGVLAAARPDRLLVVGPAGERELGSYAEGTPGYFRGFGVETDVRLGRAEPETASADPGAERPLPTSLAVAAWLLNSAGWADAPIEGLAVGEPFDAERCIQIGREAAGAGGERVVLLVMGDGSACRTLKAPGYLDERAAPYDAAAARALGAADVAALKGLDLALSRQLKVSGRAPWQVLAGAAEDAGLSGSLLYDDAPYGVGYLVAAWS
ncbi:class III extradiol dioxygenase subunit B-like domain-containing protein [Streptomyces sp. NPDC091377]|uniref:class III extradiol dioxygenase subunit B-like domain-containing protein n=1 Tax=unclassified Streptomyces TaxID=2593676 RepID=UPI0038158830